MSLKYIMSCPKGQIKRASYKKVGQKRVSSKCIEDMGKPGKGPYTLPKLSDDMHLSRFGYSLDKPEKQRRLSLKKASKKNKTLKVLRRLNLIRNYTAVAENKKKLSRDVDYMKRLYDEKKDK
jgi:hypothetical protein